MRAECLRLEPVAVAFEEGAEVEADGAEENFAYKCEDVDKRGKGISRTCS